MSLTKNQIFRLNIIDELLTRKKWVKTKQIQQVIQERLGEKVSQRTIQNDIRELRDDSRLAYYAPIEYDNYNKAYKYSDDDYSIKNFGLRENEIIAFRFYANCLAMFSGYSLFSDFSSGLNKIIDGVSIRGKITNEQNVQRIIQTDSLIAAKGNEFLGDVVFAVDKLYKIELTYQSFDSSRATKRTVFPYYIKEYKNRWYLLGVSAKENKLKTYAFDRIKKVDILDETFNKSVPFDADTFFKHSFGITDPNQKIEEIILRFDKKEMPYIKSLPIHTSQRIVKETGSYSDISIKVGISYELKEYILSKTPTVKVIAPISLADEISKALMHGKNKYLKKPASRK